jgi:hypothetical protein
MQVIRIIGVGTNHSFDTIWQSPDLPAPAMLTAPSKEGGAGWVLLEIIEVVEEPDLCAE